MDSITQAVLGAAIAEAGWRHRLGKPAIVAGVLFGLLPDADVVSALAGEWHSMVHHRGITHSLVFAPVMCWPLGWLAWRKLGRGEGDVRSWVHLAFWAMWTHPLLDVFTTYGTQLALPFTSKRFAIDGVSIIDPLYTFPLMGALLVAYLTRARPHIGRRLTATTLALTTAYLLFGVSQAARARDAARAQVQVTPGDMAEVRATPTIGNVWLWRVLVRERSGVIHVGNLSHIAPRPIQFHTIPRPQSPWIDAALEDERGATMRWFADDWLSFEVNESSEGASVMMYDQRYGSVARPTRAMWGAQATFDAEGSLVQLKRVRRRRARDLDGEWRALRSWFWTGRPPAAHDETSDDRASR